MGRQGLQDPRWHPVHPGTRRDPAVSSRRCSRKAQLKGAPGWAIPGDPDAAVEGAQVDFDTASHREPLLRLAGHRPDRQEHDSGVLPGPAGHQRRSASRLEGIAKQEIKKIGVLGAYDGRWYRSYVSAKAGYDVVLMTSPSEAAEKGKYRRPEAGVFKAQDHRGEVRGAARSHHFDRRSAGISRAS